MLRYTTQDPEDLALGLGLFEVGKPRKDLLLGLIADAARVVKHELGVFRSLDLAIVLSDERAADLFAVVDVHLTAKRLDVEGFPHDSAQLVLSIAIGNQAPAARVLP